MRLTGWFPYEIKPEHIGVYRTRFRSLYGGWKSGYSHWNGSRFGIQWNTKESATWSSSVAGFHCKQWRGLAEEPKK